MSGALTPPGSPAQCGSISDLPEGWQEVLEPLSPHLVPRHEPPPLQDTDRTPDVTFPEILILFDKFRRAQRGEVVDLQGLDLSSVVALIPPVSQFQAAAPAQVAARWRQYFTWAGLDRVSKRVLPWIEQGYQPEWVRAFSSVQQAHPKFQHNLAIVSQQIAQVVGHERVNGLVDQSRPQGIHFPNRRSVLLNAPFVSGEVEQALARGVVRECSRQDLVVVNGLGVVGDPDVKARLVVNAMYVNLFVKYEPFHYQSLRDLPVLARPGDVIMVTDFKSGYHHVPLHPSVQKYFGFEFQGRFFCFVVLPFGLASGCSAFTQTVQAVMRPLEDAGLNAVKFIDDIASCLKQGAVAVVGRALQISLFRFLRLALTQPKCVLDLPTAAPFLGLVCDLEAQRFFVPPAKREAILHLIQVFLDQGGSKRDLARLAGKFVSIAPAVQLAPLYSRRLFQAMTATQDWEDRVAPQEELIAQGDLLYFKECLNANVGWTWDQRADVLQFTCAGDASETGYGGHSDLLPRDFVLPFSSQDHARMQEGNLSSTLREVKNACLLVSTCIRHSPDRVRGATITCLCDNQGAVANINNMRGSPEEVDAIRHMWVLASQHNV
jgi:hypothetical protein